MLNIYQRIDAVRKEVAYVQKDKRVEGYMAVTHDQVTAMVRNDLIKHGIVTVPSVLSSQVVSTGTQTKGGTPIIRYEARFQVDFVNIDDPKDRIPVIVDAHANDHGDKAPGKALSYSVKNAILKLFNLETGEDDEGRYETFSEVQKINENQVMTLKALVDAAGRDPKRFLTWAKVDAFEDITVGAYPICKRTLEAAVEAAQKESKE